MAEFGGIHLPAFVHVMTRESDFRCNALATRHGGRVAAPFGVRPASLTGIRVRIKGASKRRLPPLMRGRLERAAGSLRSHEGWRRQLLRGSVVKAELSSGWQLGHAAEP